VTLPFRYRYHFPFLDLDGLAVDDNRVGPLYGHVFPPKYAPSLSFVGVPSKVRRSLKCLRKIKIFRREHIIALARTAAQSSGYNEPRLGVLSQTLIFQALELESKWVAAALSGRAALPGEEGMMAAVREGYRRMEAAGRPKRHTHALWPEWVSESIGF